jgi:hypothetical protein
MENRFRDSGCRTAIFGDSLERVVTWRKGHADLLA